jgi:hypothetical protein
MAGPIQDVNIVSEEIGLLGVLQEIAQALSPMGEMNQNLNEFLQRQLTKETQQDVASQAFGGIMAVTGASDVMAALSYANQTATNLTDTVNRQFNNANNANPTADPNSQQGGAGAPPNLTAEQLGRFTLTQDQFNQQIEANKQFLQQNPQYMPTGSANNQQMLNTMAGAMAQQQISNQQNMVNSQAALATQAQAYATEGQNAAGIVGDVGNAPNTNYFNQDRKPSSGPDSSLYSKVKGGFSGGGKGILTTLLGAGAFVVGAGIAATNLVGTMTSAIINRSAQTNPLRQLGYAVGSGPGGLDQSIQQTVAGNLLAQPWENALGITGRANKVFGLGGATMTGSNIFGQALKDVYSSGGLFTGQEATLALQEGYKRGYSGTTKGSLFGQFYGAEKTVTKATFGLLDPATIGSMLDLMFRKFGQNFDTTSKTLLSFNTAAQSAQKGLVDYTQQVMISITALQQQGTMNARQATIASQIYSSLPQLSSTAFQSIAASSMPFLMAQQPGRFNSLDYISLATGNANALAGMDPAMLPLLTAQGVKSQVETFLAGVPRINSQTGKAYTQAERLRAAAQLFAQATGQNAGDILNLISNQNITTLRQQQQLGLYQESLTAKQLRSRGGAAHSQFGTYLKDFNAAYGVKSKAELKQESSISSQLAKGKITLGQAIQDIQKLTSSGAKAQAPVIGTITVKADPGTKITSARAGSKKTGNASTVSIPVNQPTPTNG